MKKLVFLLMMTLVLTGCAAQDTLETVADDWAEPAMASPRQIQVELPGGVASPVLETTSEQVYLCDGYEIIIETIASGDLNATMEKICGYGREDLGVMTTSWDGVDRHEFVWTAAGEEGERLGRAVVLDDGSYHYCMSVLRDASTTRSSQISWRNVFASFTLL